MPIGEPNPLLGEPVNVGRENMFGRRAVTARVPVAEIVGEDDDDVGLGWLRSIGGRKRGTAVPTAGRQ